MNPFVDPKKRSISLPSGCKDLGDVLRRSDRTLDSPFRRFNSVRRFIHLVLFQAQHDQATELIIGATASGGETPIQYKIEGAWYDMAPLPSHIRLEILTELARMAKLPAGHFRGEGVLDVTFMGVHMRWKIRLTSADDECILVRVHD